MLKRGIETSLLQPLFQHVYRCHRGFREGGGPDKARQKGRAFPIYSLFFVPQKRETLCLCLFRHALGEGRSCTGMRLRDFSTSAPWQRGAWSCLLLGRLGR